MTTLVRPLLIVGLCVALTISSGCGTIYIWTIADVSPFSGGSPSMRQIEVPFYPGVSADWHVINNQVGWIILMAGYGICLLIDTPLSFAADTMLLPLTLYAEFRNTGSDVPGQQLHTELDQMYRSLRQEEKLGLAKGPGVDVSPTVTRYVNIGMDFDEAEKILKAAGFYLEYRERRRPPSDLNPDSKDCRPFCVRGVLPVGGEAGMPSVSVVLFPDAPGDPNARVKSLQARITKRGG